MADKCPQCGIALTDDPKFCPACGARLKAASAKQEKQQDERRFVLRGRTYGDTAMYDDVQAGQKAEAEEPDESSPAPIKPNTAALYLSLTAIVLSVAAIILVLIFAVFPSSGHSAGGAEATSAAEATEAPTQAPTEPPISGTYQVSEFLGKDTGVTMTMLKTGTLEMRSDYTGKITFGSIELGDVTLDKESDSAVFMGVDCTYTFDGNVLTIDYNGITIVYKKA